MFFKDDLTNVNDLRIAKLYNVTKVEKLYSGKIYGIETAKVVPFFVLIKKTNKGYVVIPTQKFKTNKIVFENVGNQHDLVVNKTNINNRYRKPISLFPELEGKKLTNEELVKFAEMIETINAELPAEYAEEKLKLVCMKQNQMLSKVEVKEEEL